MLLDIKEPEAQANKTTYTKIVGIDFGTTNSLIAYCDENGPIVIPNLSGSNYLKSIITYKDLSISSIKRIFGKSLQEIKSGNFIPEALKSLFLLNSNKEIALKIEEKEILPIEIASEIFKILKHSAETYLKDRISKAVITVPAYFDEAAKIMVRDSARLAGLEVVRMIAEPTASAYSYSLDTKSEGNYLVYDIGGGTFDVSILQMRMGAFQVLATNGHNLLGGDDIDKAISEFIQKKSGLNINDADELRFLEFCRSLKESNISYESSIIAKWKDIEIELSPDEFKEIVLAIIKPTIQITKKTIRDSEIEQLDGIILVGGMTKLWVIRELIQHEFPEVSIIDGIDPDKAVVIGAAKQAWNIASKSGDILIDITPLSLGIEMMGGIVEKIIPRNTPIPAKFVRKFTTYADNQTGFDFHIVQGDRELASNCRSLARFSLKSIPHMQAGKAILEVGFTIDNDGLLTVNAQELISGMRQEVVVKPSYGLSEEKVIRMLKEAMENAEYDHFISLYTSKVIEIDAIILKISHLLEEHEELLSKEEQESIKNKITSLQESIKSNNYNEITKEFDELQKLAEVFVERVMSKELTTYLGGKQVDELL